MDQDVTKSFQKAVSESFVVVPHKEEVQRPSLSEALAAWVAPYEKVWRVEQIKALAAGQSERDQPVCSECLKQVVAEVERLVEQAGHTMAFEAMLFISFHLFSSAFAAVTCHAWQLTESTQSYKVFTL